MIRCLFNYRNKAHGGKYLKNKRLCYFQARLDEVAKKKRDATEKKEDAEKAFNAWKNQKDEARKKALEMSAKDRSKLKEQPVDKEAKLREAREAYEAWLEFVEQREEEKRFEEEERQLREMWRPPWYPGGKADL